MYVEIWRKRQWGRNNSNDKMFNLCEHLLISRVFCYTDSDLTKSGKPLLQLRKAIGSGWGLACSRRSASSF